MSRPLEIPLLGNQAARGLDSHQSETDLAVTPDKWSRHIPHIRRLYIDEELPLEEVMKIMARDYKFHAGKKTYKTQLKKFGIRKNVFLDEKDTFQALQLISWARDAERTGRGPELLDSRVKLASGQVVGFKRLASHLERKKIGVHGRGSKLTPAAAHSNSPAFHKLRAIDAPDAIRLPELVFSDVARYVSAKFSIGPAPLNPEIKGPSNPLAIQAHSAIDNAAHLLEDGKLEDAIVQLRLVPERMKVLLGKGDIEPPMTLFLIWKTIISLIASAAGAGVQIEGTVKSLVRYTATICHTSASLSPQLRRILAALSQLSQIEGSLMFETAVRGFMCMLAQQDLALGIPDSCYSSIQQITRDWFAAQKWMMSFEYTIWLGLERLVRDRGESSPETIAALYSILVLERQKDKAASSNRFQLAVEQTLAVIPDDWALAIAHREAHMQWAMANMPQQNDSPGLVEAYMRDALETAMSRQQTTLHELSALRTWLAGHTRRAEVCETYLDTT